MMAGAITFFVIIIPIYHAGYQTASYKTSTASIKLYNYQSTVINSLSPQHG